jgi:hypothetical protein
MRLLTNGHNYFSVISLPLRSHWLVLKESAQLYVLTWTNRNEAVNILTKDEIMIEQARARKETGEKIETADFIKSVEELYPKLMKDMEKVGSVGDVVGVVSSNKEELKKVAADRLEIMGEALHQFMVGYREGRDAGHREAMEDDKFVQSMFDLTNAHDNGRDAAEASASTVVANASGAKPDGEGRASSGPNTSVVRDADARVADKSTSANNQASSETSNGRGAEASATTKVN